MKPHHWVAARLLLLSIGPAQVAAEVLQVELFTGSGYPVSHLSSINALAQVTVYQIDDIERINADLVKDLPKDEARATKILRQRFETHRAAIETQYTQCAEGVLKAYGYQLNRYPAVVFDGQAIVYGVPDLQLAYRHYQDWQSKQRR